MNMQNVTLILTLYSCGDAMCIMGAASTFSEPFITSLDRRRLSYQHKNLAGTRFSDHVAMLHAFQAWEEARGHGESSEMAFCEQKQLQWQILRMTCEAKNQLRDILVNSGFPEECLAPQSFSFNGPDLKLDVVSGKAK